MAITKFIESGTDATQDFSFFQKTDNTNGTTSSDSTQFKDGSHSIKSDITLAGGLARAVTNTTVVADAGALISAWFRFSTVSPGTISLFLSIADAAQSTIIGLGLNTNGTLRICGKGCTAVSGSTVLLPNTWYRISIGYIITSSSNWSATVYINGISEVSTSNTDGTLSTVTTSIVQFGLQISSTDSFGTSAVMTVWIDSIYIDDRTDKTDCGEIHVTAKRPFSNGTTNGFATQIGSGGSGYGSGHSSQINEQPLSITNGWSVVTVVSAITEEYNIETQTGGEMNNTNATIVDYMGWVYTKALNAETAQIIVNNVTSNISVTTSAAMFTKAAGSTTYPAGSGTDIGIISAAIATTISLYECGIVVAIIFNSPMRPSLLKPV